jgi:hypothetical protein
VEPIFALVSLVMAITKQIKASMEDSSMAITKKKRKEKKGIFVNGRLVKSWGA